MLHISPTSLLLLAAKQEPFKKAYLLTINIEELCGEKSQENAPAGKKTMRERATGLGRRTREETVK